MSSAVHPASLPRFSARRNLSHRRALWATAFSLFPLARAGHAKTLGKTGAPRRVAHVSPCYFSDKSMIGGGERYAMSLAEGMADLVETVFISFGEKRESFRKGNLQVEVYPALSHLNGVLWDPVSYGFMNELGKADVVHCHQNLTLVGQFAILGAAARGKRVFVTDLGGRNFHFENRLPLHELVNGYLQISDFATRGLPETARREVIFGGVPEEFYKDEPNPDVIPNRRALFVGRQLPHKGINYLIEGLPEGVGLDVAGRIYNEEFSAFLTKLAEGKDVRFLTGASDNDLRNQYSNALVTILPSVYKDVNGQEYDKPELLGLVLLESMACGTPVICTDVGAMPEIVQDGVTGFVVPPNDPKALGEKIAFLSKNPETARQMGLKGRERVLKEFTWEAVVRRCLTAYQG